MIKDDLNGQGIQFSSEIEILKEKIISLQNVNSSLQLCLRGLKEGTSKEKDLSQEISKKNDVSLNEKLSFP